MAIFNEAVFENSIIELLEKLGYKHIARIWKGTPTIP